MFFGANIYKTKMIENGHTHPGDSLVVDRKIDF